MSTYFVIMGAKVRADGSPSGSLERRIEGAYQLARNKEDSRFVATGAVGDHPPAEAIAIRDALMSRGIGADRILLDEEATDTLSSIRNCARILHSSDRVDSVVVCSDRYHTPRCALLFRLLGIPASMGRIESGLQTLGLPRWIYYWVRDLAAIVWDVPQALVLRHTGRCRTRDSSRA